MIRLHAPGDDGPVLAPRYGAHLRGSRGFSLVELLIALTICALISGAVAATVPPSRAAFEHTPAVLDTHQRTRTAVDAIEKAVRGAIAISLEGAAAGSTATVLQTISHAPAGSHGVLAVDQVDGWAPVVLSDTICPAVPDVCGFRPGVTAMIADGTGRADVFLVADVDVAAHAIASETPFAQPYSSGAVVSEVDAYTFRLVTQANGSSTLVRETVAGAVQPVVDAMSGLAFEWRSPRELDVRLHVAPPSGAASAGNATVVRLVIFTRNVP